MTERIKYKQNHFEYEVHYTLDNWRVEFSVYPIGHWTGPNGTEGYSYSAKTSSDDVYEFDPETCRCLFEGSYVWRGVWEGRLYFKDDEYWDHELAEMSSLFTSHIEPHCKDLVRTVNKYAE